MGSIAALWAGAGGREKYYLPEQSDGCRARESDRKQVGRIMFLCLGAIQKLIGERRLQRRTAGVCASQRENNWMTALTMFCESCLCECFVNVVALNHMWALL